MPPPDSHTDRRSLSLSAGSLTQLLASVACFLGAYVLPKSFEAFRGASQTMLIVLGVVMLSTGLFSVLFGRRINRAMIRAGRRSRVVVPREGIGYLTIMLVLAVGGLLGHRNMPLLVFGMMAGPFILNGAFVYHMLKGTSVVRRAPRRALAGSFVTVELEVKNSKRWLASHMLEVRDQIDGDPFRSNSVEHEGVVTFVRVPATESRTGRYQVCFRNRGLYSLGPVRISSRFPLGIGERGQMFQDSHSIVVHPMPGKLLPTWTRRQKEMSEATVRVHSRLGIFDDEFHRIREYRSGDNPRNIHWRSTARQGRLMIREFQQRRQADSLIVLDLPTLSSWSNEDTETAISLAATICLHQTQTASGSSYLLAIASNQSVIVSSRSPSGFREQALDALAVCKTSEHANLQNLFSDLGAQSISPSQSLILITPRPDVAIESLTQASKFFNLTDVVSQTEIIHAETSEMETLFHKEEPGGPPAHQNIHANDVKGASA